MIRRKVNVLLQEQQNKANEYVQSELFLTYKNVQRDFSYKGTDPLHFLV